MTPIGLKSDLMLLGWSQRYFAERTGVHPNTVSSWVTGRAEIPRWVEAYLGMARWAVEMARSLERPKRKRLRGSNLFQRKGAR